MEVFLILNGYEIEADTDEQEQVILDVAAGQIKREELKEWLRLHIVKKKAYRGLIGSKRYDVPRKLGSVRRRAVSHSMKPIGFFRNRRRYFAWLSIAFIWLFFGSRYLHFLFYLLSQAVPSTEPLLTRVHLLLYPFDWLFTYLEIYIGFSALGLALIIAAVAWGRPGRLGRVALAGGLLAILALPVVYQYQPVVRAETGYVMRVPTEPGALAGVVKATQVGMEVRRCEYELLGWSRSEGALYGEEVCGEQRLPWVYWPMSDHYQRAISTVAADLVREEAVAEVAGMRATYSLDGVIRGPVLRSPEGWWYAAIARHSYGPEDVIVVSASKMALQ